VVQVAVAIGLVSLTAAIFLQTRFAMDGSPGFDPAQLLVVQLPVGEWAGDEKARGLRAALARQAGHRGSLRYQAIQSDGLSKHGATEISREGGGSVTMDVKSVSPNSSTSTA